MSKNLTVEQYQQFYDLFVDNPTGSHAARAEVAALRNAGWTIEPPETRYYIDQNGTDGWHIFDREAKLSVAYFYARHRDGRAAAEAEASRLNEAEASR